MTAITSARSAKDRIGEDRIGKDRKGVCDGGLMADQFVESSGNFTPPPSGVVGVSAIASGGSGKKPEGLTVKTWQAYASAFQERYKTAPVRNATVNGQLANFVKRVGEDLAPKVIEFYVWHPGAFYVKNGHQVRFAVADAEKLAAEFQTKRFVSNRQAQEIESKADAAMMLREIEEKGI